MRKSRELESVGRAIIKSIPDLKSAWPGKEKAGKGVSQRERSMRRVFSLSAGERKMRGKPEALFMTTH